MGALSALATTKDAGIRKTTYEPLYKTEPGKGGHFVRRKVVDVVSQSRVGAENKTGAMLFVGSHFRFRPHSGLITSPPILFDLCLTFVKFFFQDFLPSSYSWPSLPSFATISCSAADNFVE